MSLCLVLTLHNVEQYAHKLNASIDYTQTSVVIVDDNSRDDSAYMFYPHTVLRTTLRHPSQLAYAANWGETQCPNTTDYVAFIDGDDFISANYIPRMMHTIVSTNADVVISQYDHVTRESLSTLPASNAEHNFWTNTLCTADVIEASPEHPCFMALTLLNPLPGRRIHKRSQMPQFREGSACFEDNAHWWDILATRPRIAVVRESLYTHRSSRSLREQPDQSHMLWHIKYVVSRYKSDAALVPYICKWIETKSVWKTAHDKHVRSTLRTRINLMCNNDEMYTFSVVIPCHNIARWSSTLASLMNELLAKSKLHGISTQIIFVNARSTDATDRHLRAIAKDRPNVLVMHSKSMYAGNARNYAVPFVMGKWCAFLDADDIIKPNAWISAVRTAMTQDADVVFVKYKRMKMSKFTWRLAPMFNNDAQIWKHIENIHTVAIENATAAFGFINYPWTRLVRTSLIQTQNIHFGVGEVHNDILYHWLSLAHARRIAFVNDVGVIHRYHSRQLTALKSKDREYVSSDICLVHRRVSQELIWPLIRQLFIAFSRELFKWIATSFTTSSYFNDTTSTTLKCIASDDKYSCVNAMMKVVSRKSFPVVGR